MRPTIFTTDSTTRMILEKLNKLERDVQTIMSTTDSAASILAKIPTIEAANSETLKQLGLAMTAMSTENAKLIADAQALIATLQTGQPTPDQVNAAATSLANISTNNASLAALATQMTNVAATDTTFDQSITGTAPAKPTGA